MSRDNRNCLEKFKSLHEKINKEIEDKKWEFFYNIYHLIKNWEGELPNLRDILRPEEIHWFLTNAVECNDESKFNEIIDFVINTGYKDEPDVDYDGKPWLRRTTPVHHAIRSNKRYINDLFKIYDRFDVNYTDENGLTHFHVACMAGCYEVVEKFLELGRVDPNLLVTKTGDSPLHLAVFLRNKEVIELLLRSGADLTCANKDGRIPLHTMSQMWFAYKEVAKMLFEMRDERYPPVQVNAQDKLGNAPLHYALEYGHEDLMKLLLRNGANPNIANAEGSTPLHFICKDHRCDDDELLEQFLEIGKEVNQPVQVDALDNLGRTPLQWAVANLLPDVIDVLLDNGVDLSNFVFPDESYFAEKFESTKDLVEENSLHFNFYAVPRSLVIVERLEKRGYELELSDVLTIMKCFAKYELFQKLLYVTERWYERDYFAENAKEIMINDSLSLYDLMGLQPEAAAKLLTYEDYLELVYEDNYKLSTYYRQACGVHLCEMMSRGFYRRWALPSFEELTHYQLPNLCCDLIIKQLTNDDLFNICLAAEGHS